MSCNNCPLTESRLVEVTGCREDDDERWCPWFHKDCERHWCEHPDATEVIHLSVHDGPALVFAACPLKDRTMLLRVKDGSAADP
jgi:hypothetical protein